VQEEADAVYKNTRGFRGKGKKGRGGRPMAPPTTGWENVLAATQFGPGAAGGGAAPQMQAQNEKNRYDSPSHHSGEEEEAGDPNASSDDEALTDYQVDGYHVVHIK
jgi:hypothetical protein